MRKLGSPQKARRKKSKPGWEIRLETQVKKTQRKQAKMIKQKKDAGICRNKKEKAIEEKNNTIWGNKPESTGERKKIKEISTKSKIIDKTGHSKTTKKIQLTTGRRWHENITTTGCKRNRMILDWNMATKKHNEKAEWINNMTRELEGPEEGPKAEIFIDFVEMTRKNINLENARPWWNSWFLVREIHLHSLRTSTRNEQMPTRSTRTRMDD